MPVKPDKKLMEKARKNIDPKKAVLTIINETPVLRDGLLAAGIIEEVK